MKQFKLDVLSAMEAAAKERHCVKIKTAATAAGVDRLTRQDVEEIVRAFCKRNPEWKPYLLDDGNAFNYFESAFVSDNECPYED